jgi:hypothetical protein
LAAQSIFHQFASLDKRCHRECCGQEDVAHKVAAQLPSALEPVIHELKQHSILTQHGRVERYAIFYRWLVSSCGW